MSAIGLAAPMFWTGMMLIAAFGVDLNWLPVAGRVAFGEEECRRYDSGIFTDRPMLDGAVYPVPTSPSLGIEVDEDAFARAGEFEFVEMPHLRRADGSHTNR